jgi:hypothetical protein
MQWDDFSQRLGPNLLRLEANGVAFRIPEIRYKVGSPLVIFASHEGGKRSVIIPAGEPDAVVALAALVPDATIHYTLDGSDPTPSSAIYRSELHLALNGKAIRVAAIAVLADHRASAPSFLTLSR